MPYSATLYFAFLGFVILERVFELWLSRRNAQLAFAQGAVEVGQGHFRVMSLMHSVFFAACVAEVYFLQRPFLVWLGYSSVGIVLLAQALRYWAISTLGSRWNVRIIVLPNAAPVTHGPYRFVRHPNYLAVIVEILFLPLIHGAYLTALFFSIANAVVLWVRIQAEEAALGSLYQNEFSNMPRFIP